MKIFVSGTVAYDVILDYAGKFADHVDPKKAHVLSVSFLVENIQKTIGGTGANIAYNLSMLDVETEIVGTVGLDGQELIERLKESKIGMRYLGHTKKLRSSQGYMMTDSQDNQVAGFYPGAMQEKVRLPKLEPCDWPIIAAESPDNMLHLAKYYQKTKHKYIYDPGQQVIAMNAARHRQLLRGASILVGNDYEIDYLKEKLRKKVFPLVVFRTLGPKGSQVIFPNGQKKNVKIAKPKRVIDPTGAGDAYRAGMIKGVISGFDLLRSAQLGATAASFAVEQYGTQNHKFDYGILKRRYKSNFKEQI